MESKSLTWEELANKISEMPPLERKETVKVWSEDRPLHTNVSLCKESEDMCYYEDSPEDGCDIRSSFDEDADISVALEAGKYYLWE